MYNLPQCVSFHLVEAPKTYTVNHAKEHLQLLTVQQLHCALTDKKFCPICALTMYLLKTKHIRSSDRVFIRSMPLYTEIAPMTLNYWILKIMKKAGVDISQFGPYSTRHMASSKALQRGMSLDEVVSLGGWTNPSMFIQHYNLPILRNAINTSDSDGANQRITKIITPSRYIPPLSNPKNRKKLIAKAVKKKALQIIKTVNTHQHKRHQQLFTKHIKWRHHKSSECTTKTVTGITQNMFKIPELPTKKNAHQKDPRELPVPHHLKCQNHIQEFQKYQIQICSQPRDFLQSIWHSY